MLKIKKKFPHPKTSISHGTSTPKQTNKQKKKTPRLPSTHHRARRASTGGANGLTNRRVAGGRAYITPARFWNTCAVAWHKESPPPTLARSRVYRYAFRTEPIIDMHAGMMPEKAGGRSGGREREIREGEDRGISLSFFSLLYFSTRLYGPLECRRWRRGRRR